MSDPDPRADMATAIINALLDSRHLESGQSIIDPDAARYALVMVLAMMLEADPNVKMASDMREVSERIARELRVQLRLVRDHFPGTGMRAWNARLMQ